MINNTMTTPFQLLVENNDFLRAKFDSPTLLQEMAVQSPTAISKIHTVFQFIQQYKIRAVLIGGMAVAHWISRSITPDTDFLVDDLGRIEEFLRERSILYTPLAIDQDGISISEWDADFLDTHSGNVFLNRYIMRTAVPSNIGGIQVLVIDPAVLAIQKMQIGRNKDLDDAFKLLKIVDIQKLKIHLKQLQSHIQDPREILNYAKVLQGK